VKRDSNKVSAVTIGGFVVNGGQLVHTWCCFLFKWYFSIIINTTFPSFMFLYSEKTKIHKANISLLYNEQSKFPIMIIGSHDFPWLKSCFFYDHKSFLADH
jgi:hypothetical protein